MNPILPAAEWIRWSESWWDKTGNPLHVWRALAYCLNADPPLPIPGWCLPYLQAAAVKIEALTCGRDFHDHKTKITAEKALSLAMAALDFSTQGKKNAFARVREDSEVQRHALDAEFWLNEERAVKEIEQKRNISKDRAARRLAKGKRLNRLR